MSSPVPEHEPPSRSPSVVSLLSLLWPGLGQLYLRRWRWAALFALPALLVVGLVAWQLHGGLLIAAVTLLDPAVAALVLWIVVALAVWRIADLAIVYRRAGGTARSPLAVRAIFGLVLAAILVMHSVAGYYAYSFYDAGRQIFVTPPPVSQASPDTSALPSEVAQDTGPIFSGGPWATPASASSRVTFLLTGVDSGHDRNHALTDTLLLVSVDPVADTAAMLSFPRDISAFPTYNGLTYSGKINSLMTYANGHPSVFPDGGIGTLSHEIGFLIGLPVHYYAAINLDGFQTMVDMVGGVDINNPKWIIDPTYDWFNGTYGFTLSPGLHHLDGVHALAYVRSRKGIGDNDFTRAARQQQLLIALRAKMSDPSMLARLPDFLRVAAQTIQTDIPPGKVRDYLILANQIADGSIQRYVLGPPYSWHPDDSTTGGTYTLRLKFDLVAQLSVQLFGSDSAYAPQSPAPTASPGP